MNLSPRTTSRRAFLRTSTLAAAGTGLLPSLLAQDPGKRIQVGFMGLHSRGTDLLKEFLASDRIVVTWLCDVDQRVLEGAGKLVKDRQALPFKTTDDFRKALDDGGLQALVIAAPDHWHAPAAILATQAGKDVYVEKPLTHNPREGEWLIEAVKRSRTVLQVGLQRRSLPWIRQAIQRVREGTLGPVYMARAWYAANRPTIGFGQLAPVPDGLNYTLWQGPAPERPFRDNVVHYNWHWFWNWGTGEIGNNGVHFLDLARWGLNVDCPSRVTSVGGRYFFDDDQESPDTQVVTYDFGGRILVWEHRSCQQQGVDGEEAGVAFYGRNATLYIGGSGFRILDPKGTVLEKVDGRVPTAPHVANFLDGIANRAVEPNAPVQEGNKSTLLCHLGNIAQRTGSDIQLNPATSQLRNERTAAAYWSRQYREGWRPRV